MRFALQVQNTNAPRGAQRRAQRAVHYTKSVTRERTGIRALAFQSA